MMITPERLSVDEARLRAVHALTHEAFAYMDGIIDPPSSIQRFDLASLQQHASKGELIVVGNPPVAAMVMQVKGETLYLGKIAVSQTCREQGLARALVDFAADHAGAAKLLTLTLQSRVELTANHATFRALGFTKTGRTAHPGFDKPTYITFTKRV